MSPFGYGEVCGRDTEAILGGCLLVKPDMSHIRSLPDFYVSGETYVPVRWDYADLAETCEYYLDREEERARIAANAYRVLADSFRRCVRREVRQSARAARAIVHTPEIARGPR